MSANCPLCGRALRERGLRVEADRVIGDGGSLPVGPVQAMIIRALIEARRPLSTEDLAAKVYWNGGPDDARGTIRVHLVKVRRLLAGLGWCVANLGGGYGGGHYVLKRREELCS